MDKFTKKQRSYCMSQIKSKNTSIEKVFKKSLRENGITYCSNVKNLLGKPDFAFKAKRVVIFLDSCFWHKCPKHFRKPKSRNKYWKPKIDGNVARDKKINNHYKKSGWVILRFWEHEILENLDKAMAKTIKCLRMK